MVPCARCQHAINAGDHRCAVCNAHQPRRAAAPPTLAHQLGLAVAAALYVALAIWLWHAGFVGYVAHAAWTYAVHR